MSTKEFTYQNRRGLLAAIENIVPKQGEVILEINEAGLPIALKIGDGITPDKDIIRGVSLSEVAYQDKYIVSAAVNNTNKNLINFTLSNNSTFQLNLSSSLQIQYINQTSSLTVTQSYINKTIRVTTTSESTLITFDDETIFNEGDYVEILFWAKSTPDDIIDIIFSNVDVLNPDRTRLTEIGQSAIIEYTGGKFVLRGHRV